MKTIIKITVAAIVAVLMSACAVQPTNYGYGQQYAAIPTIGAGALGQTGSVKVGTVVAVATVNVQYKTDSRLATAATSMGAAGGLALGSKIGSGTGKKIAMAVSGLVGAAGGNAVAANASHGYARQYVIRTDNRLVNVTIETFDPSIMVGMNVMMVETQGRVVRLLRA